MRHRAWLVAAALMATMPPAAAWADDVTDQIDEALAAYRRKDLATAQAALQAALDLMRQSRADSWKALLPDPPSGWTGEDDDSGASGTAMFGGGTSAVRKYRRDGEEVEISILADSPLVQGMAAMLSLPAVAAGAGRTVVVGGRRMTYVKNDNAYMTLLGARVLVRIQGSRGVEEATLRGFVGLLRFDDIEKAVR